MAAPASAPAPNANTAPSKSSSSKRKNKLANRTASPAPSASPAPPPEKPVTTTSDAGGDDDASPYIREIQKNIRNNVKRLTNISKSEAVAAEHPDMSLDDLVNGRLINADQKAAILKKPILQAQLEQMQEHLAQAKQTDQELRARLKTEKEQLKTELVQKYEAEKAAAVEEALRKAEAARQQTADESYMLLSQFLRLAAARRTEEADPTLDENLALEGVLLAIYAGDESAVETIKKLVQGTQDKAVSVSGDQLQTTFAQVQAAARDYKLALFAEFQPEADPSAAESDSTVAHAGLTEIAAGDDTPLANATLANGHVSDEPSGAAPANADIDNTAANAVAEVQWSRGDAAAAPGGAGTVSISQEWVEVPNAAAAADATPDATPVPSQQPAELAVSGSWADDHPEDVHHDAAFGNSTFATTQATEPGDGFHQVSRGRRGGGGGNYRSSRGDRGDRGRGRGRGNRSRRGGGGGGGEFRNQPRRPDEAHHRDERSVD